MHFFQLLAQKHSCDRTTFLQITPIKLMYDLVTAQVCFQYCVVY